MTTNIMTFTSLESIRGGYILQREVAIRNGLTVQHHSLDGNVRFVSELNFLKAEERSISCYLSRAPILSPAALTSSSRFSWSSFIAAPCAFP